MFLMFVVVVLKFNDDNFYKTEHWMLFDISGQARPS